MHGIESKTMNKAFALIITLAFAVTASGRTVIDYFTRNEAGQGIPLLDKNTRLDMSDYFKHGLPHVSTNVMGGSARILEVNDTDMRFEITSETPCQLAMLTSQRDTTLMLIETMSLPQADSRISFYDKNWNALKREAFVEPKLADWLTATGKAERNDVEQWLPFLLWRADYSNGVLTLTSTLDKYYIDEKDVELLNKWIKPELKYSYNGKKFSLIK